MKAILVIDEKPKTCEECRYSIKMGNNGHWFGEYCTLQSCGTDCDENGLDKYCPLKPMPQKKSQIYYNQPTEETWKAIGYNHCIDEILGEKDEKHD